MASDSTDLKIDVQQPSSWSRRLSITVPASRVKRERTRVAEQYARNARLPGFRKGKLPTRVVEQRFGPSIEQEALDRLIQDAYREAVGSQGFTPITQGKVDNVHYHDGQELHFDVEFEVQPTIELERVSGFTVTRPVLEVGEEDVDAVIERLRDERAAWDAIPEGENPDFGDQVLVEITALEAEGGAPLPGEEARSYRFVIGEGQAIPEVEEAIRTLKPGEEGNFTVHFPDDFPDEARRGAEQHLFVALKGAQRKALPQVDDEFAKAVGEFETVAELRARILSDLGEDAAQRAEAEVRNQLVDQLLEANPFEAPASMVDRYLDFMINGGREPDGRAERSPEETERMAKLREGLRSQAEIGLKRMLVVDRLAEREGLRATQDEIDARVEELAERHGRSPSEVWIQLEKSGQLETLEREITEGKVFGFLTEQNTVA